MNSKSFLGLNIPSESTMRVRRFWEQIRKPVQYCLLLNGVAVLTSWYAVSPVGFGGFLPLALIRSIVLLVSGATGVILPIFFLLLIMKRYREKMTLWLIICLLYSSVGAVSLKTSEVIRLHGFSQLAKKSTPLIQAIHRFEAQKGRPPETLQELVPRFLPDIPTTQMPTYPKYHYVSQQQDAFGISVPEGNAWMLYIHTPIGIMSQDMFLYLPSQNYPTHASTAVLKRIKNWVYVSQAFMT